MRLASWFRWPRSKFHSAAFAGRPRQPRKKSRLHLESLEDRLAPAVIASYADSVGSVALDPGGDIYVAGQFRGQVDFDPGAGQAWLQGGDTSAYFAQGNPFVAR